jgi:hypothetical protein
MNDVSQHTPLMRQYQHMFANAHFSCVLRVASPATQLELPSLKLSECRSLIASWAGANHHR